MRLARTETIGPVTFYALLRRFGSARAALDAVPRLGRRGATHGRGAPATRAAAERELTALDRLGARLLCGGEPLYPRALTAVEDAPPVLALLGRREISRRADDRGGRRAQRFGERPPAGA